MMEPKFIYKSLDIIALAGQQKGIPFDEEMFRNTYDQRLACIKDVEDLRKLRNQRAKEISSQPGDKEAKIKEFAKENQQISAQLKDAEEKLRQIEATFRKILLAVPTIPSADTPLGKSDADNVELRKVGELPKFDFKFKDHIQLGTQLGIINFEQGAHTAGTRSYYLVGAGAELERAIQTLALNLLKERGYTQLSVPTLVKTPAMEGTGYLPGGAEQAYHFEKDDMWLIGTSEVPLTSYYREQHINPFSLPVKMCAWSPCYRREAGSAGKDTKGLYRVHQFQKIEQVVICQPDIEVSNKMHAELLQNAEDLLKLLELPYRVVQVCTGDLGQGQVKKNDIETWMPSRNAYGETHSCSSFYDFQAQRLGIKTRMDNKTVHCFTLNNTAVATPRILIPLLECHQTADGHIRLPAALQKIMNQEFIGK